MSGRFKKWFQSIRHQLFEMNDTPQRVALGLAIGVFFGIFPGTGPLFALGVALILKINRAATLLGAVLTNTWLSVVVFVLSLQLGSFFLRRDGESIKGEWQQLIHDFQWAKLFDRHIFRLLGPLVVGFLFTAGVISLMVYVLVYFFLARHKRKKGFKGIFHKPNTVTKGEKK